MSADDPRGKEEPNAGSVGDDLDPERGAGEDPLGEPGVSGIEAQLDVPGQGGEPRADDSAASPSSVAAGSDPDAAAQVADGPSVEAIGAEHAPPIRDADIGMRRSKRGWIIGGSVAAAVVLVAVIAAVAVTAGRAPSKQAAPSPSRSTPAGNMVTVPDLVGMAVGDARSKLGGIGLPLSAPDGSDDGAIVTTQTPSEGERVAIATKVVVTVAQIESLSFDDGAVLDPLTKVGWQFSFSAEGWSPSRDAGEGKVIFANDAKTCTAQYWQEVFDTAATDDLAASDEFLAKTSGATADDMAKYAYDGHFALSGGITGPARKGSVATRTLLWSTDKGNFLLTGRVFQKLDSAKSKMSNAYLMQLQCNLDVDPQDVVDSLDELAKVSVAQ